MKRKPQEIFREYEQGIQFQQSLGTRGLSDQSRLNERFYCGDQWYGAKCGNDRPLVRHNIIKRIGDFKMSQVLSAPFTVQFSAEGIPTAAKKTVLPKNGEAFSESLTAPLGGEEVSRLTAALGNYHSVTAERVGFTSLCEQALRNAYISGSTCLYTYWDNSIQTGLFADEAHTVPIEGDIACEVLNIENVIFADPYLDSLQKQPYIILAARRPIDEVLREAEENGSHARLNLSRQDSDGKITVLTKLFREYKKNGECTVHCIKTTERELIRPAFDTGLRFYPLALFSWEQRGRLIYGESEVTYLIPNQIAINRMITASVWSSLSTGMPMMVVNGDTVTEDISNDPGQILRVFGSNEDVAGAVHYITPPDLGETLGKSINELIENTLTQSGANEVARGDSRADNATALITLRNAATLPLQLVQNRFYCFIEEIARIWADFWFTQYGTRDLKLSDNSGTRYIPFHAERYRHLQLTARIDVDTAPIYSTSEQVNLLMDLYDKGILNQAQLLERLPEGMIKNLQELLTTKSELSKQKGEEYERI